MIVVPRATPGFQKSRGFSLIEMIAVIVLVGIAISVVTMSFSKSLDDAKVQAASRDLVAALRYTRGQAIVKGQQTAQEVVETAMRAVKAGRTRVVSGMVNRIVSIVVNFVPNALITRAMAKGLRDKYQEDR